MDIELFVAFGGSCKSWAASPGLPKFLRSRLSTWCPGIRALSSKGTSAWAQISESREAPRPVTDPYKTTVNCDYRISSCRTICA